MFKVQRWQDFLSLNRLIIHRERGDRGTGGQRVLTVVLGERGEGWSGWKRRSRGREGGREGGREHYA